MTVTRRFLVIVFGVGLGVAGAIGCRSHTGPSDAIAGSWHGRIADSVAGAGTMDVSITRKGPALSGTWSAKFDASGDTRAGGLSGTLVDSNLTVIFVYDPPMVCPGGTTIESTMAFNGTLRANGWSGSYVALACTNVRTGTIDVARP
jgi:hypothetical protein